MSVLCQAVHARPEPFAIRSHTAGHLSGGAPDPGTIPTKVGICPRLGPGTASMPAISGSAKSWNHPNILPDMGGVRTENPARAEFIPLAGAHVASLRTYNDQDRIALELRSR